MTHKKTASLKNKIKTRINDSQAKVARQKRVLRRGSSLQAKVYAAVAVGVLLFTTIMWAFLGAKINQGNADQLVNNFLFENADTFRGASFPAAHSFLIKWPLFWLTSWLGSSSAAFTSMTIAVCLATVAGLAYILYRIDRRPLVFGTLYLALASVLLFVPAQPYAGGILPVNMAMITTRNLEYLLYIGGLILLLRSPRLKSWQFLMAVVCLGLLGVSDKLFVSLSIGGAALGAVTCLAVRQKYALRFYVKWFIAGVCAFIIAVGLAWLTNRTGVTHIAGGASTSPYGIVHSGKQLALGVVFGFLGILTNFGANPAYDAAVLRKIPELALHQLASSVVLPYVINAAIFFAGIYMAVRMYIAHYVASVRHKQPIDTATGLSVMLLWSSIVAIGVFVLTDHYYVVDARYVTITVFAVFISAATFLRSKRILPRRAFLLTGLIIGLGTIPGMFWAVHTYNADKAAMLSTTIRNTAIVQSIKVHHVDVLVGDYWRVMPIKLASNNAIRVTPLGSCAQPSDILSSREWKPDLKHHSFAYILSFDKSLTNYSKCTLQQVTAAYGRPNQSVLIAGSMTDPKELVLFYDYGAHPDPSALTNNVGNPVPETSTVLPIKLSQLSLSQTQCPAATTVMNIVAHEDDDLLFMNPELLRTIQAGNCVRTVYLTSGDSGSNALYWQNREKGAEAAYSLLQGSSDIWIQQIVRLASGEFITIVHPRNNPKISLVFIRLPDGNIGGQGFEATNWESLARLEWGQMRTIHTTDHQSVYDSEQLTTALVALMQTYKPTEIRTQAPYNISVEHADHSDHLATGRYVKRAYDLYESNVNVPIDYYVGYPVRDLPQNVFDGDLIKKTAAFLRYARFDGAVCHSQEECSALASYGSYLKRQYTLPQ